MGELICHVTTVHPIWDTRIFHRECRTLVKAGYHVRLMVLDQRGGTEHGVEIHNVESSFRNRLQRISKAPFAMLKELEKMEDVGLVHLHDPELLRIAGRLKKMGKKVVYDAHEDHPRHVFEKRYFPNWLKRPLSFFLEKYENAVVRKLDGVVTPTPLIRERFSKVHSNTVEVRNTPDLEEISFHPPSEKNGKEICYVGKVTPQRGAYHSIQAMAYLEGITLNLVGPIPEDVREELSALEGWKKVREYGVQEREGVREVLDRSSAGLVVLQPYVNFFAALPVKMFEYMAAGVPVLSSDFKLWADIVEGNDCGVCVDPTNPKRIAEGVQELLADPDRTDQMGRNGRKAVEEEYNWGKDAERLLDLYKGLV